MAMTTEYQDGNVIDITLSGDVSVRDVVPFSEGIAIALGDGVSGDVISGQITGVHSFTADSTSGVPLDVVYWNATAKKITKTSSGNVRAGRLIATKTTSATTALVKINA